MNENEIVIESIESKIYSFRNKQIMLDRDIAFFYGVETRILNQAVKRNIERFPEEFCFQLTNEEFFKWKSQFVMSNKDKMGLRRPPYAFTEQGLAMLSAVLKTKRAVEVSINIMKAFATMRKFIISNAQIFQRLDTLEIKQTDTDKKLNYVLNAIESKDIQPKQGIFFDGQIFDSYVFVSDIIKAARKSIVIIDNYIDENILKLFSNREKNISLTIYTNNLSEKLKLDVKKFNEQYPPLKILKFDKAHDRFIIIDEKIVYHFGASLKDLGKKWFAFSKMDISAINILEKLRKK